MKHVKLGCKNVKIASCILKLCVILKDAIHRDFLYSTVNAEAVAFVNHVIPYGKLGKCGDLLSGILRLFSALLFLLSENVRFRDNDKFCHWVRKSLGYVSVLYQNLSRLYLTVRIL